MKLKTFSALIITIFLCSNIFAQKKANVVVTASMLSDMAKNIGGDFFDIETIVPVGGDPHIYKPTPGDARQVSKADLVLMNGLTFEGWLTELIENSGTKAEVILATKGIDVIASLDYANSTDPHAWMDASNGLVYIENIKNALIKLAPEHKAGIERNYNAYYAKIKELDTYIEQQIKSIPAKRRILITSHDAFQYYGKRYGIRLESVIGTSTDAQAQTSDISRINKVIKENDVPAVFIESTINPKLLKQLAADNKVEIGGELFADSIGKSGGPGDSYYKMLKYNTDVITKALKREVQPSSTDHTSHTNEEKTSGSFLMYGILGLLFIGGFFVVARSINK